jgi:hypothetical protein
LNEKFIKRNKNKVYKKIRTNFGENVEAESFTKKYFKNKYKKLCGKDFFLKTLWKSSIKNFVKIAHLCPATRRGGAATR